MKRIILHWTAGTHTASKTDKKHYHYIVQGDGTVVEGDFKPEDNESTKTPYAAHTRGLNTGSIGVAVAAMSGARERPFDAGKHPITEKQLAAMVRLVARLSEKYDIPVQGDRILTHAEVQPTLGVKQNGKWDINWLPGMAGPVDPVSAGMELRARVRDVLEGSKPKPKPEPKPAPQANGGLLAMLIDILRMLKR